MKRFALLLLISAFAIPHSSFSAQPNLILILADDLGYSDLGCYGNTFNETPNIDRLAREGMRFTQFYAGPVCSPTRCNLQSGQDQARFGITQHIPGHKRPFAKLSDPVVPLQMPLEVETFAECLAKAGYATGYFGKWHLGGAGFSPADQGWQTALECNGNTQPPRVTGCAEVRRTTDFLADKAIEFINAHKDKPFLLQVSHGAVHIPLSTTPELKKKYENKSTMPGYPSNPEYAGLTEELDQSVGRVVEAVEKAGIADSTLILFLSDNGGLEHEQSGRVVTSNKPLRSEKGTLYEGGVRVPAFANWPKRLKPALVNEPLHIVDWYPTLLTLAGASLDQPLPLDGKNAWDTIAQGAKSPRTEIVHNVEPTRAAIRMGDWKLIEHGVDGAELFNIASDPGETTNLAAQHPERVKQLSEAWEEWNVDVNRSAEKFSQP